MIVGGITPSRKARMQKISSTPPLAPRRWPSWLLVLEMLTDSGVFFEDGFHGRGFGHVAQGGACAVGVDVIDIAGIDAGIFKRLRHGVCGGHAVLIGSGDMSAVATDAVPVHFGVDSRAAGFCVLEFFQDQQAGAFAENKAVAVAIEGSAGFFGIVVALGQGAHGGKGAQADGRKRGLAAAGNGDVDFAVADELKGVADGVGCAGAGGDDDLVRAVQAVLDGELALAALPMSLGMVKAETLSGPLSKRRWCWTSMVSSPPMPDPRITPQRQVSSLEKSRPESRMASRPLT